MANTTALKKLTLFPIFLFFLSIPSTWSQNNCPTNAPASYEVEYSGADCFLTFTWPTDEMPLISCGSPGSPATGSTPSTAKVFDLTLNGTVVYEKGNNCSGTTFNLAYHPTMPDTYITTISLCAIAALDSSTFVMNRSGGSNFSCDMYSVSYLLPVELISFNGREKENAVVLEWATASELNNSHFEIERSLDGRHFDKVGKIEGMGTSTTEENYNYVDRTPLLGDNFYRLKQVDFDGKSDYSKTIQVKINRSGNSVFYPTKVLSTGILQFDTKQEETVTTTIFDVIGREIQSQAFFAEPGLNSFEMDMGHLNPGSYFMAVVGEDRQVSTVRFVKVK